LAFSAQLDRSFDQLDRRFGDHRDAATREAVLSEYLREVEAASDSELLTSILLLDDSGRILHHGAAPSLPADYCAAIDGIEIGSAVGSCGTAAFVGHSIYVTDIASDPLWGDFRELALAHDLRACWSTPILDEDGNLLGTFATYYRTPRAPLPDEIAAINAIGQRVASAVAAYR
jgi:GAF domain-containing protein